MKFVAALLAVFISLGSNLTDNFLARLGFQGDYLITGATALVVGLLLARRSLWVVIPAIVLCFGANLPLATASSLGLNRDYLTAAMFAVVLTPYLRILVGFDD